MTPSHKENDSLNILLIGGKHKKTEQNLSSFLEQITKPTRISRFTSINQAIEHLGREKEDVILLYAENREQTLSNLAQLAMDEPHVPVILLVDACDEDFVKQSIQKGAEGYLVEGQITKQNLLLEIECAIERKRFEESLRHSESRLRRQNQALQGLAKRKILDSGDLLTAFKEITEAAAGTLDVERASVWLVSDDHKKLRCIDLCEKSLKKHTDGTEFNIDLFPTFLKHLGEGRPIAVHDIKNDLRTKELSSHFDSYAISAALYAPIRIGSEIIGFVSQEHTNGARKWDREEKNFAISVADLAALAIEAFEEKRQNRLTHHDNLTDLPNRMLLMDRLNQAIIAAHRYKQLVALLFLDLDQFKQINETVGHAAGDKLLQAVSERLKNCLFETDTVTRLGGDKFAILLPELLKMQDVTAVANKIFAAFYSPFTTNGQEFTLTCSIGISIYPTDGQDAETMLHNAESAKSFAKGQGKNNYQFYSPAMNAHVFDRLLLINNLRRALEQNEFRIHYQPFVNVATGKVVGMEALIRWERPNAGMISPATFIPLAEDTGLIIPIGEFALRESCRQLKKWMDAGFPPMSIAVNVSPQQFLLSDLPRIVARVLKESGLNPTLLKLEMTETAIMQNSEKTIKTLMELHSMGIKLSIDDFGKGYWPLTYLTSFPIANIKIDQSFVQGTSKNMSDRAIIKAIISMAHSLNLEVIAEGVETEEQLQFIAKQKCDIFQGYLFSKALAADDFTKLLLEDRTLILSKQRKVKQ